MGFKTSCVGIWLNIKHKLLLFTGYNRKGGKICTKYIDLDLKPALTFIVFKGRYFIIRFAFIFGILNLKIPYGLKDFKEITPNKSVYGFDIYSKGVLLCLGERGTYTWMPDIVKWMLNKFY